MEVVLFRTASRVRWVSLAVSVLSLLTACGGGKPPASPPLPPPIPAATVTLSANPGNVVLGASSTLTWSSTNATACTASGAWAGAQVNSGTASVTPAAVGNASYTLSCTGTGGTGTATAVVTVAAPPPVGLTFNGRVVEPQLSSSSVTLRIGNQTFTGVTDASGRYSITALVPADQVDSMVSIDAAGISAALPIRFRSLPGRFSALRGAAGADNILTSDENFDVVVSSLSTADAVLMREANGGDDPVNDQERGTAQLTIDQNQRVELAALITGVLDNGLPFPAGITDTIDLIDDEPTRYAAVQTARTPANDASFVAARNTVVSDPATTRGVSATDLPPTLFLATAGTRVPNAHYGNITGGLEGYEFTPGGTGSFLTTYGTFSNLRWNVEASRSLALTFSPAQLSEPYFILGDTPDPSGLVRCVQELNRIVVRRTGSTSVTRTATYLQQCDNPSNNEIFTELSSFFWTPQSILQGYAIPSVADRAFTVTVDASDLPTVITDFTFGLTQEIARFASSGTGTLSPSGRTFQWAIESDGALRLTLANGFISRYRRLFSPFGNLEAGVAEHRRPDGRRAISNQFGVTVDTSLTFSTASLVGTYYQFGIGGSSAGIDTYPSPLDPILRGSAYEYDATGGVRFLSDGRSFDSSTGQPGPRQISRGSRRVWTVRPDGSHVVQRYLLASTNGNGPNCVADSSDPDCVIFEQRRAIPLSRNATGRQFWLELMQTQDEANFPESVSASTPYSAVIQYYDYAPSGAYGSATNATSQPEEGASTHSVRKNLSAQQSHTGIVWKSR